jgi:predicted nucleic acid-binding protein
MWLDAAMPRVRPRAFDGIARVLLVGALRRRYQLLASVPLMIEYESVLTRPEHLEAAGASHDDVQAILDAIAAVTEPVTLDYLWRPTLPDADDDMVLETAVNGRADALVTFDPRDFSLAMMTFAIRIQSPAEAVAWIRRSR